MRIPFAQLFQSCSKTLAATPKCKICRASAPDRVDSAFRKWAAPPVMRRCPRNVFILVLSHDGFRPTPKNAMMNALRYCKHRCKVVDGYVRLSIGIEHIDDILADLNEAFAAI